MSKSKIIQFDNNKYARKLSDDPIERSDELLDMAIDSTSKAQAVKYVKQALEAYPDNIDAQSMLADFEEDIIKRLKKYDEVVENATRVMKEQNMFDKDNIGCFWGIIGTRPYMRARHRKILTLMSLGRYTEAIKECEEMLELCVDDNLGIRYILIGMYCLLEKFDKCEGLYSKYQEDSLNMVLVMAIMYFKKGNYKKAKQFLEKVEEQNEYILDFLLEPSQELFENIDISSDYYTLGSEEEAFTVVNDLVYLLASVPTFLGFILNEYLK